MVRLPAAAAGAAGSPVRGAAARPCGPTGRSGAGKSTIFAHGVYRRLGYRPVEDRVMLAFT
ncbi:MULTISPECIES: hypothetical protein [unclassified Spirillospora]|uniref:hypothetical protein n=1 Tax=unclassified Spirillospora TaxID=2642701 RepID=UPI00370FD73E